MEGSPELRTALCPGHSQSSPGNEAQKWSGFPGPHIISLKSRPSPPSGPHSPVPVAGAQGPRAGRCCPRCCAPGSGRGSLWEGGSQRAPGKRQLGSRENPQSWAVASSGSKGKRGERGRRLPLPAPRRSHTRDGFPTHPELGSAFLPATIPAFLRDPTLSPPGFDSEWSSPSGRPWAVSITRRKGGRHVSTHVLPRSLGFSPPLPWRSAGLRGAEPGGDFPQSPAFGSLPPRPHRGTHSLPGVGIHSLPPASPGSQGGCRRAPP